MKKISIILLGTFVLCFFLGKDIFLVHASTPAENQYYCFLASVYDKATDRCISIFEKDLPSNLEMNKEGLVAGKVIYSVKVKKGDTCISLTKKTQKPLSYKECSFLKKIKTPFPFLGSPILHIDDVWELIAFEGEKRKNLVWNIVKKKK